MLFFLNKPMAYTVLASMSPLCVIGAPAVCEVKSGNHLTPVIELYTSEGCSSCPPADQWLSTLKGKPVVAQAFHVAYWDYIGWKDPFALPAFTARQKEVAAANRLNGIYTPQFVRNGRDWRNWRLPFQKIDDRSPSRAVITLRKGDSADVFEARVAPTLGAQKWTAYWTVTEHNHDSRVKAGENAGEFLKHNFVVRQYVPVGNYEGVQSLKFDAIPAKAKHPRQINLIVSDVQNGETLQALSLQCA